MKERSEKFNEAGKYFKLKFDIPKNLNNNNSIQY